MESLSERSPASRQPAWSMLRRLQSLFGTPSATVTGLPVACPPEAIDAWPAGLRILVADDNPLNLMVASEMLVYLGVQSMQAADGAEAVAMAATTRLDLILMDLQMPVLDGLDATRQIRGFEHARRRARVPVVAYTSLGGNRRQLADHGIDDLLEKPCELAAMRACLLRWCPMPIAALARPAAAASVRQ